MARTRERKYNPDGTRTDENPATRLIIGVDGEGWDIPLSPGVTSANPHAAGKGWHSYVLLAACDDMRRSKVLWHDNTRREATETTARNYGLPTVRNCDFLLSLPEDSLVVGFYFNYDTTKIFADLPITNLRELNNEAFIPQKDYERRVKAISQQYGLPIDYVHNAKLVSTASTVFEGYHIQYTQRKELRVIDLAAGREWVRDHFCDKNNRWRYGKPELKWKRRVIVWDVFTFFQKSFVRALEDYRCGTCEACARARDKYVCKICDRCQAGKSCIEIHCLTAIWTPEDLEHIAEMKLHRGAFDPSEKPEIESYCLNECRYLSFLVRDLLTAIDSFGLKLNRFDGSGAIASAWLKANQIKKCLPVRNAKMGDDGIPDFYLSDLPEHVALSSYFGGRFEISEIGYVGSLYGYDINSAYPFITATLPCLAHGRFRRVSEYVPGSIGVYLTGSRTSGPFAPFPFRTNNSIDETDVAKDAIYYCHGGKRWIWQDEIVIAREHFGTDAIPVFDGWIWEPDNCDCDPFGTIPDLYGLRKEYVKQGNGIERVIKLILNSLYGKTAQSIGWNISKSGEKIPPPFQCFIWAGLITSGCRAMILDAIMQKKADVVSIATDGILSRNPISLDAPNEKILGKWEASAVTDGYLFQSGVYTYIDKKGKRKYATRGFSSREISAEELIGAYQNGQDTVIADPTETRFVSMKSAIGTDEHPGRTDALEYIGQWIPSIHDVKFTHNRRVSLYPQLDPSAMPDFSEFTRYSEPHTMPDDLLSAPYTPKQTWEDVMENQPLSDETDFTEAESWQ